MLPFELLQEIQSTLQTKQYVNYPDIDNFVWLSWFPNTKPMRYIKTKRTDTETSHDCNNCNTCSLMNIISPKKS
jgi:hypothetical protein